VIDYLLRDPSRPLGMTEQTRKMRTTDDTDGLFLWILIREIRVIRGLSSSPDFLSVKSV